MAAITIDYELDGDVYLILVAQKEDTTLDQTASDVAPSNESNRSPRFNIGPLNLHVDQFRFRVSSLKLISSSHYFRAMLEGPAFREGKELEENGVVEIDLTNPEDNPTAMMILLGILYENDMQVPNELDFVTLHNVAILVDKYQWHELVLPRATAWFDRLVLSIGLPDVFNKNLLVWLWMSWLFKMEDHFKTLSRVAQQHSPASIDLNDETIRVPANVLLAINKQREAGFQKVEQAVEFLTDTIFNPTSQKDESSTLSIMVRALALGAAMLCCQSLKIGSFAVPDHAGCSIQSLGASIDLHPSTNGFHIKGPGGNLRMITNEGRWNVKYNLQKTITDLKIEDWGLDYKDFKP